MASLGEGRRQALAQWRHTPRHASPAAQRAAIAGVARPARPGRSMVSLRGAVLRRARPTPAVRGLPPRATPAARARGEPLATTARRALPRPRAPSLRGCSQGPRPAAAPGAPPRLSTQKQTNHKDKKERQRWAGAPRTSVTSSGPASRLGLRSSSSSSSSVTLCRPHSPPQRARPARACLSCSCSPLLVRGRSGRGVPRRRLRMRGRTACGRRDETCPLSTKGGTRRVQLVRGGEGRGGTSV